MAIHELISNKNTIRICGNKTFYKKLFYVNSLEDIAAMNAPGSVYVKYPAGTAALCAEDSTVYVLVRDDNPYGEVNEENARYEPMTDGSGVTPQQLEAALATKYDIPTVVEQTAPTAITLADNTEYYLTNVSDLSITYPSGRFEAWIRLTTAASGTVTVTLPASQYIGSAPAFGNGETWEISIKNGIVAAAKVGDGT